MGKPLGKDIGTQSYTIIDKPTSLTKKNSDGGVGGREKKKIKAWFPAMVSCHNPPKTVPTGRTLQCTLLQSFLFLHFCRKMTRREEKETLASFSVPSLDIRGISGRVCGPSFLCTISMSPRSWDLRNWFVVTMIVTPWVYWNNVFGLQAGKVGICSDTLFVLKQSGCCH